MLEEFNDFLETVSDKPETRMAFLLLYWTGMRIGELLALTYDDINLEEKTISITKSYQRLKGKDVITQPKTPKSIRIITMPVCWWIWECLHWRLQNALDMKRWKQR